MVAQCSRAGVYAPAFGEDMTDASSATLPPVLPTPPSDRLAVPITTISTTTTQIQTVSATTKGTQKPT